MAKEKEETPEKKSGGLKTLLIALAGVVVLMGGAFAFVTIAVPPPAETEAASAEDLDPSADWEEEQYRLEVQYVNLAGTQGKRYLKVGVTFRFLSPSPSKDLARFAEEDTLVKDHLLMLLSGKTLEDIDGAETKRLLKQEILETLNTALFSEPDNPGRIEQVYYYEFLVQ